ncbi:alpha/beta-hydrolase [Ascobolus immersus RN42]|uniref:Carboxypeptidase n=1 Tax=Ascobolus immersus RN42 TaxID=1160509 RepID=A0A3N4IQM4_ASCIM|nr:alpha/beta-hydrolase [Ascobolus immersus RN42]
MKFFSGLSGSALLASLLFLGSEAQAAERYQSPIDLAERIRGWNIPRASAPHVMRRAPQQTTKKPHVAPKYLNDKTKQFYVNGSSIPEVDWDAGESYAGLIPISKKKDEDKKLFYWYWPTAPENPNDDELVIWFNGGPGCSSLEGFLQENGPIFWQWGTFAPVPNQYSWHYLTNMVWVEQPVGTGFSTGKPTATSSEEAAEQFLGFLENFIDTFDLHNKKIYVTGESYAGFYVPYVVDAMYRRDNKTYFDARGLMIYNPVLTDEFVHVDVSVVPFVEKYEGLFGFSPKQMDQFRKQADECGYTEYLKNALSFPLQGKLPGNPGAGKKQDCKLWMRILNAAIEKNPCFNVYMIPTYCPLMSDPLGYPGTEPYLHPKAGIYFQRPDVQQILHTEPTVWETCSGGILQDDTSTPSTWEVLPRIIPKNERTIISHGVLDYRLLTNGTILAIQNMTWNGQQGFQKKPTERFIVPYDKKGDLGIAHTERGLTYVEVNLAGHMVPQFQPSAAYFQLEFLLGRKKKLI